MGRNIAMLLSCPAEDAEQAALRLKVEPASSLFLFTNFCVAVSTKTAQGLTRGTLNPKPKSHQALNLSGSCGSLWVWGLGLRSPVA